MNLDKATLANLKVFSQAFHEARERKANESDTVMFLVKFFEQIGGFDSLHGEISKEVAIKDRYCDFAVKLDGTIRFLVEAKAVGHSRLRDKDIEQAENYASRSGIRWVLLTNGINWQLFHLSFNEGEGISHELAYEMNLLEALEQDPAKIKVLMDLLDKEGLKHNTLETFWQQKKTLSPASMVRALFSEDVLNHVRRELNRSAEIRLEMHDVFEAMKEVLSKDALMAAGDIKMTKHRKRRRKVKRVDHQTGKEVEIEEEVEETTTSDVVEFTPPSADPTPAVAPAAVQAVGTLKPDSGTSQA